MAETAPNMPEPTRLEWAITEARRMAGDRIPTAPAVGEGAAEVPGSFLPAPVWTDAEWAAELGLWAALRGPPPGAYHYNPYAAAAAFLLSPEAALKRRTEDKVTEEYADPVALAASLTQRAAAFTAKLPALTADLAAQADADAAPSLWADLSVIKRGY